MVYVDAIRNWGMVGNVGPLWSHMFADTLEELHEMASKIGMKREWFQDKGLKHYDLVPSKRKLAVARGAIELEDKEFVQKSEQIRAKFAPCERILQAIKDGKGEIKIVKSHLIQCEKCRNEIL